MTDRNSDRHNQGRQIEHIEGQLAGDGRATAGTGVTPHPSGYEQANAAGTSVTPGPVPASERMRQMRARNREAAVAPPIIYQRADWQLFCRSETLPQQAGCEPDQVARVVLKELVDNALDAGADVKLEHADGCYTVTDNGPGIDPAEIPKLFAVNRPLLSSKLKRLPLRGMLGNGLRVVMGAVAAFNGTISVTSRGRRLALAVNTVTGLTEVTSNDSAEPRDGTAVEIKLWKFDGSERKWADQSIRLAAQGRQYTGPSLPAWYGPRDLVELFARVMPQTTLVSAVLADVFGKKLPGNPRPVGSLTPVEVANLHTELLRAAPDAGDVGNIGDFWGGHYAMESGVGALGGAQIPFTVEVDVTCEHIDRDVPSFKYQCWPLINRAPALAPLTYSADSDGLSLHGCGLSIRVPTAKRGRYKIYVSIITPHLTLTNAGKSPYLTPFSPAIAKALKKAAGAAYRAMIRPPTKMSIADAASEVMEAAYLKASDGGKLPANARQIMYAARPAILEMTGVKEFGDSYFTQTLLPDFVNENPECCSDWDVVFDSRGHFVEPHTGRVVPLGTLEVRGYLGGRPQFGPKEDARDLLYPTSGPANRYRNVLFVEKEGFDPLLAAARIAERFDIAIMSTKGLSVTAARLLIDRLTALGMECVFVLHDFDVAGFSIFGTLGTDGRRYVFDNKVKVVDLGLRLSDVAELGLQSEPVTIKGSLDARAQTLREHGATDDEIRFLLDRGSRQPKPKRVELNAMTSRQFIDFIERKLTEHRVEKVIPQNEIIERHARRLLEQKLTREALAEIQEPIVVRAAETELPDDLEQRLRDHLAEDPALPWDEALAIILGAAS
jgi:hypothetical protein